MAETYHLDLSEWVRRRRWPALYDYLQGLPSTSRLQVALAGDPEHVVAIARYIDEHGEDDETWEPPRREWTLECELIAQLIETVVAMLAGADEDDPFQVTRPSSEVRKLLDFVQNNRRQAEADALLGKVVPGDGG